jgi:hypothetical protein
VALGGIDKMADIDEVTNGRVITIQIIIVLVNLRFSKSSKPVNIQICQHINGIFDFLGLIGFLSR